MTDKETLNKLADEHGYSDKMGNVSGLFEHFELGYTAAQAEIARLKDELKNKNESGCCIVEHGYRMQAEHDLTLALKIVSKLQCALDVAVEGLGFFATDGFYRMTDFVTASPVTEVGKMPENIKVYGNPVLTLGLKKALEALEKIKQIREIR